MTPPGHPPLPFPLGGHPSADLDTHGQMLLNQQICPFATSVQQRDLSTHFFQGLNLELLFIFDFSRARNVFSHAQKAGLFVVLFNILTHQQQQKPPKCKIENLTQIEDFSNRPKN